MMANNKYNLIISIILAFLYALFLTYLPDDNIKDRLNYLNFINNASINLDYFLSNGFLSFISNEPIWLMINFGLNNISNIADGIKIIIFFSAFTVSLIAINNSNKSIIIILLFLLFPQIIKNHIIHLRQGLAVAVFLIGWYSPWFILRWAFILAAPFIHSSFFFIIFLIGLVKLTSKLNIPLLLNWMLFFGSILCCEWSWLSIMGIYFYYYAKRG